MQWNVLFQQASYFQWQKSRQGWSSKKTITNNPQQQDTYWPRNGMHFKVPWVQSVSVASSSDRFKISSPRSSCYFALQMMKSKYKWFSMIFVFCSIPDILQTWMEQYILVKCERSIPSEHIPIYHHNIISHRIHVWYIYMLTFGVYWWDLCHHI